MHKIRIVKCPKCGAEVQVFDTDQRTSCPKCGTSFEVPSLLDEKLAEQAKEAMEKSVSEIQQEHAVKDSSQSKDHSGKIHKVIRMIVYVLILLVAFCILLMATNSHAVK